MNKEDLVNMIAAKTRLTKKETIHILDSLTETIMETVASGDKVGLVGFVDVESDLKSHKQEDLREACTSLGNE